MSTVRGVGYVTMRARKPFHYRGMSIEPGDTITLPWKEGIRLRQRQCLEHLLAKKIRARMYPVQRSPMELTFE